MAVVMNRTMATPRYAVRKLRPQALEESSCSISTKRPLHAAIEARIDCFALLVIIPSRGSYKMGCFLTVFIFLSIT